MSAPTAKEEQLLKEFYGRVKDVLETEDQQKYSFLIRWLRARDLDLTQAESMLRASLAWRKENKINAIRDLPVDPYFQQEFPFHISGADKQGHPVIVVPMGQWDFRKIADEGKTEEFKQYVNFRFEDISQAIEKINKVRDPNLYPITQYTSIMDWKGYSYMQLLSLEAIQNLLYTVKTYEAHYPEMLSSAVLVNCPSFFNVVLMMVKQTLPGKTFEKLKVFGCNRKEWEQGCREIIDDDQLQGMLALLD